MFPLGERSLAESTLQVTRSAGSMLLDVHLGSLLPVGRDSHVLFCAMRRALMLDRDHATVIPCSTLFQCRSLIYDRASALLLPRELVEKVYMKYFRSVTRPNIWRR